MDFESGLGETAGGKGGGLTSTPLRASRPSGALFGSYRLLAYLQRGEAVPGDCASQQARPFVLFFVVVSSVLFVFDSFLRPETTDKPAAIRGLRVVLRRRAAALSPSHTGLYRPWSCGCGTFGTTSRPVLALFCTRITAYVTLIELRQALVSYQDYRMCYPDRVETGPDFVPGLPHVAAHSRRAT